jgi:hypothetical protein
MELIPVAHFFDSSDVFAAKKQHPMDLPIAIRRRLYPEAVQALDPATEILDLRHFAAPALKAVLEAEGELWEHRLHWDYQSSARLLMQYLDNHMLPGFAAVRDGLVTGYVFCVYEETKAVIGDVFALPPPDATGESTGPARGTEETLLRHLFELLLTSPHVDRIESQLRLLYNILWRGRVQRVPPPLSRSAVAVRRNRSVYRPARQSRATPVARGRPGARRAAHLRGLSRPP